MIVFPPAKINLGLNVVRRREDGFHDIESVLVQIPLCDVLEAVVDDALGADAAVLARTGVEIPGLPEDDLCMKAIRAVQKERSLPGLRVHLHKVIPTGAGLGGGSSDGAHMILLLERLCELELGLEREHAMAASLGSDVPFFLSPTSQLAEGRGEILRPAEVDLSGRWLMLVNPGVHVATAEVYRNTKPSGRSVDLPSALQAPMARWNSSVVNVMEQHVLGAYPQVARVKERLLEHGAIYAAMSGSGSSVFGFFEREPAPLAWPEDHKAWTFQL